MKWGLAAACRGSPVGGGREGMFSFKRMQFSPLGTVRVLVPAVNNLDFKGGGEMVQWAKVFFAQPEA